MGLDLSQIKDIMIPEGSVKEIKVGGETYWKKGNITGSFYIYAIEDCEISLVKYGDWGIYTPMSKYGIDDSTLPNNYTFGDAISLTAGQKCYFYVSGVGTTLSEDCYLTFTSTGKINACGKIDSLNGGNWRISRDYCFKRLFYNCTMLMSCFDFRISVDFANVKYTFLETFEGCSYLTNTPYGMLTSNYYITEGTFMRAFANCRSIPSVSTPTGQQYIRSLIPGKYAMKEMFLNCVSLTKAIDIELKESAEEECAYMFKGCTGIKLSKLNHEHYQTPYRVPKEQSTFIGLNAFKGTFDDTGGDYIGDITTDITLYEYAE